MLCSRSVETYKMPARPATRSSFQIGTEKLSWRGHRIWETFRYRPKMREALRLFIQFVVNPLSNKLRGPCPRCDDYYLQTRANNKTYCKRQCGSAKTALASTQAMREKEKNAKLEAAKRASIEWEGNPKRQTWDEFVAKRVSDCSRDPVTVKWVTRAVNNEELIRPSNA